MIEYRVLFFHTELQEWFPHTTNPTTSQKVADAWLSQARYRCRGGNPVKMESRQVSEWEEVVGRLPD